MTRQSIARTLVAFSALAGAFGGRALAASGGTITVINIFNQGYGQPEGLVEVSPGLFTGVAEQGPTGPALFLLTGVGSLTPIYAFPANAGPFQPLVQAVNGRLYGAQSVPPVNFSFSVAGNFLTYPQTLPYSPWLSVQTPDGGLYGTERNFCNPDNAFVRVTVNGTTTIVRKFTAEEGVAYGLPLLASDGNFYGISGLGTCLPESSTTAMVYRVTPQGAMTILASYPDGRNYYAPGFYHESLVQAANGKLYGTAALGGANRAGAIFEVSLDGTYKVLHQYAKQATGAPTFLTEASDGNLYGATGGKQVGASFNTLFRITPAGNYEQLYVLNGATIGNCPCWLTQGSDGRFYGTAANGGPGFGTAWVWDLGLPKPLPGIRGTLPSSGPTGTVVTIWGKNLLGTTSVTFDGIPATNFSNISREFVSATVPPGATSGPVLVTTPNGTGASPVSFTVE
ncbi:MAG: choice-of-anchor tandem repeat GloVer-containing protein [Bryobacteraceae bacterium]